MIGVYRLGLDSAKSTIQDLKARQSNDLPLHYNAGGKRGPPDGIAVHPVAGRQSWWDQMTSCPLPELPEWAERDVSRLLNFWRIPGPKTVKKSNRVLK